ncbi:SRPBCC family protein [Nocardioides sp. zg-DK7169]|uniref:SRPBCC family protein n=1 Tax=Nocardioides sp. zg-DK7169 TaxID=2736600 RepID=UPI001555E8D6|nr:SRPBCC family protein [Nocardioides sp. zg-DK7169]NPC98758.1 SRPBCC family protein [Nocardioides sp. zg-DK7169]
MTDTTVAAELSETIDIAAPAARVWALVSDVRRMAQWSPQVVRSAVLGGGPVREGVRFVNLNRRGLLVWPTQARVVRCRPHHDFAFRIQENHTIWSFALEETPEGTRVTQRREVPHGISGLSRTMTRHLLGGQDTFTAELRVGMRQTLERIRAEAEG